MAKVPKRYFERYFMFVSIALIFVMLWCAFWIHNITKLEKVEIEISHRFKVFKANQEEVYLPSTQVAGPNGDIVDIRRSDDKYTVLNIWATWCTPCIKELSSLRRLNEVLPYNSGWRVIAVSIDPKKNLPKVAKFTEYYKVEDVANYHDYNLELQKNINISKLPMTLILNKSGRILYEIHGDAVWYDGSIIDFLDLVRKVY